METGGLWAGWFAWHVRRGLSPATIDQRRRVLASWLGHIGGRWSTATFSDVEAWVDTMTVTPKVQADRVSIVRCFYRWARKRSFTTADPCEQYEGPRLPRAMPRPIRWPAIRRALERETDPRVRLAIGFAAYGGLRRAEVAQLRWGDVDPAGSAVYVERGKGGHQRLAYMPPELVRLCLPYDGERGPVFPGAAGGHVTPGYIGRLVREALARADVNATMHQLRHSNGTRLAAAGAPIEVIQAHLGHASTDTTQIYARISARTMLERAAAAWGGDG